MVRSANPAAQLMQLRKPHVIGAIDDDGVGRGHVDAALYDGRADQQVEAAVIEIDHELFQVALSHLSVPHTHARFRNESLDVGGDLLDRADLVVHEIDLATAAQLAQRCFAQCRVVPLDHERLDRETLGWRRGNQR